MQTKRAMSGRVVDRSPVGGTSSTAGVSLLIVATVAGTIRHFLVPYAAHFRALGWRVDAAANGATDDPVLRDAFDQVHEIPLSRSLLDLNGLARGARSLSAILDTGPTIVHAHTPIAGFVTRFAVRRAPADHRPAVAYTAHGFHFYEGGNRATNALFLTAERVAGRWTDRLVVINGEDFAAARRHRIVSPGRLVQMPGIGIDTQAWSPASVPAEDAAHVRERLGIAADTPVFVVVGELRPNKRQRDVINALASMRHANSQLVLLGEGPERPSLESTVADLGLRDRVHFLGFVTEVRPAVRTATALILPSMREGLARSVMEALALEVPVIASTARGNRELLGTDSGILVPTGDVRGLAQAMDRLIDHPDEGRAMSRRGRARMVEQYDLKVLIGMHETLYRGMLTERSGHAS
jgi:glycosyltransferase involved in cell wall biosynthesis